jgi:protein SCO1
MFLCAFCFINLANHKMKNLSKTKILAIVITMAMPIVFYGYFEWKKHQVGFRLQELPMMSSVSMPDFTFITQQDSIFKRADMNGKIVVANCIYTTCPGICKDMTGQMRRVEDYFQRNTNFKSDYVLLSFTVDPKTDTVQQLAAYAKEKGVRTKKWKFLTGNQDSLYNIIIKFLKLPALEQADLSAAEPFAHSEKMVLIDKGGFIRGYYDGTDSSTVNNLMRDAVLLDIHYAIEEGKQKKLQKRKQS